MCDTSTSISTEQLSKNGFLNKTTQAMKERVDWSDDMVLELLEYYEKRADSFQTLGITFFSELSEKIGIPVNRISEKFIRLKHQFKIVYENGGRKGSLTRDSIIYKKMDKLFGTSITKNSPPVAQSNGLHSFKINDPTPMMLFPENNFTAANTSKEILCPPILSTAPDATAATNLALSVFYSKAPPAVSIPTNCVSNPTLPLNPPPAKIETSQNPMNSIPVEPFVSAQSIETVFPQISDQNFISNQPQVSLASFVTAPSATFQTNGIEDNVTLRRQEIYLQKLKQEQEHALEKQKQEQFHAVEMRRLELAERELAYKEAKLALRRERLQHRWSTPQENSTNQPSRN